MVAYDRWIHPSHPKHELKLEYNVTPYRCDGCQEPGLHSCYTCKYPCNFHLHECCALPRARDSLYHAFFKKCRFTFLELGEPNRACKACGMDVKGFVYHCDGCGYDLHPYCAKLDSVIDVGGVTLVLKKKMSSKCNCCGLKKLQNVSTWAYVSKCKEYAFHISCMMEVRRKIWRQGGLADGEGSYKEGKVGGESDGREVVKRTAMLRLLVGKNKGTAAGKFAKMKKTVKFLVSFIIGTMMRSSWQLIGWVVRISARKGGLEIGSVAAHLHGNGHNF